MYAMRGAGSIVSFLGSGDTKSGVSKERLEAKEAEN
jgi:hypothetical protein